MKSLSGFLRHKLKKVFKLNLILSICNIEYKFCLPSELVNFLVNQMWFQKQATVPEQVQGGRLKLCCA